MAVLLSFGCKVSVSGGPGEGTRSATPSSGILPSSSVFGMNTAAYTWKVNSVPVTSVEFGSSKLEAPAGESIQTIELDLKELPSGDQTLASIIIETKGKNGPTFTTTTSNVGTDKGLDIRKLVAPVGDPGAVHDGTVLARGVGAFPSLVLHLKSGS